MNEPVSPSPTVEPKKSHWVRWLVLGCSGLTVIGLVVVAGIFFAVVGSMKSSGAFKEAMRAANAHPRVAETLGHPVSAGYFIGGSVSVSGPSGSANLSIPLKGPKGSGTLYVEAQKQAGEWQLTLLQLEPKNGSRIDLLEGAVPVKQMASRMRPMRLEPRPM